MDIQLYTRNLPKGVPLVTSSLSHPYNRLDYYYPKIPDTVPQPETSFYNISVSDDGSVEAPVKSISNWLKNKSFDQAFVRSVYCSAKCNPLEGSIIISQDPEQINKTIQSLIDQHRHIGRDHGNTIAVRERLDTTYCTIDHSHLTDVRYFINSGSIMYHYPTLNKFKSNITSCNYTYSYVKEAIESLTLPTDYCQSIAEEFSELSWSVDFIWDASQNQWFLIDMGLNGLYWNSDAKEWMNISGHPIESKSPKSNLSR